MFVALIYFPITSRVLRGDAIILETGIVRGASLALMAPAMAGLYTGTQLLRAGQTKAAQESACVSYLAGILDAGEVAAADQIVGAEARKGVGFLRMLQHRCSQGALGRTGGRMIFWRAPYRST
jgi:hypothetical protein